MSDKRAVAALLDTHAKGAEEPLIDEDGNTIDTDYVMARIEEIGEKITAVSQVPYIVTQVARFFPYLIGFYSNL
jgi:hypothetical protein